MNNSEIIYNYIKNFIINNKIGPSIKRIANDLGLAESTVVNQIKILEKNNRIVRQGLPNTSGKCFVYPCYYELPYENIKSEPKHKTLLAYRPDIYNKLDFAKLDVVKPELIPLNSSHTFPFKCDEQHQFTMILSNMVRFKEFHCPYCSGKRVDYEDSLEYYCKTNNMDYILNELSPENFKNVCEYSIYSHTLVKWICKKHGVYWCSVNDKINFSDCCPRCNNVGISFIQFAIAYYLDYIFECKLSKAKNNFEYDIIIESLKLLIEYDGAYFHSPDEQINRDINKNKNYPKDYVLIRVRESDCPEINDPNIVVIESLYNGKINDYDLIDKTINTIIAKIFELYDMKSNVDVNTQKDIIDILKLYKKFTTKNKIKNTYPEILKYVLNPDYKELVANLSFHSSIEIEWICPNCEKPFSKRICDRIKNISHLCDNCITYSRSVEKYSYKNKSLLYDKERNELPPNEVYHTTKEKYWFKCENCGISDLYSPDKVYRYNCHCRHCYSKGKILRKFTEVLNEIPYLTWDYNKNNDSPENFFENSKELRYINDIRCDCDSFLVELRNITNGKIVRCPNKCTHKPYNIIPKPHETLGDVYPECNSIWDSKRNNNKTPNDFTKCSGKKVYILDKEEPIAISDLVKRYR